MRYLLVCFLSSILQLSFCQNLDSLKDVMRSSGGNSRAIISKDIANRYLRKNEYDSAEKYYNTAIEISRNTKNYELLGKCLNNKGVSKYLRGDVKEGVVLYQEALEQYKTLGNDTLVSQSLTNLGLTFKRLNIYDKALENLYESASVLEKLDLKKGLSSNWNAIGNIHRILDSPEMSLTYLTRALELRKAIGYEKGIALSNQNIGIWHFEQGNYSEAFGHLHLAYLSFSLSNEKLTAPILAKMGEVVLEMDSIQQAQDYFERSITIREKYNDKAGIAVSYNHLARMYLTLKEPDLVKGYVERAKNASEQSDSKEQLSIAYELLVQFLSLTGQYQEALAYANLRDSLRSEILDEKKTASLIEAEIRYEVGRKEEEIRKRDESLAFMKKRTTSLVVVILALLMVSAIVSRSYLLSRKLALERKSSHERVTRLLDELNHRTKNHLQSQVALVKMQGRHLPEGTAKDEIKEVENRMRAITLIHQSLYDASESSIADINLSEYLKNLIENLMISFKYNRNKIKMDYNIERVDAALKYSLPIGLIVNEAVTNAFKYAFEVDQPALTVDLTQVNGDLRLTIQDNGAGFELTDELKSRSFGISTMYDLARQLKGELRIEKNKGTLISLKVPMDVR